MKNRKGRFKVSGFLLRDEPESLLPVMARVVIGLCVTDPISDVVTYYALSRDFDEIKEGCELPMYVPQLKRDGSAVTFDRWIKE